MSSTSDIYHQLLVQAQPKSILKKSSSPKFLDSVMNSENPSILSSPIEIEQDVIDTNKINGNNYVCILDDTPLTKSTNSYLSSIEVPLTKWIMAPDEDPCHYEIDSQFLQTIPRADSSSLSSDDDRQEQRVRSQSKKNYHRPFLVTKALSSSSDNEERKGKPSTEESKTTPRRSNKARQKDMQLDELMRKYQEHGGIPLLTKEDHGKEQITTKLPINHQQSSLAIQSTSSVCKESMNDDTISLLEPIDTITLSCDSLSPVQLLFDVARKNPCDRRTKIERIRQYIEEQVGISAFLTMYKLIKSSRISIDIEQKPFCYYTNLIPHLCCLIMLESEEQKTRF